MDRELRQVHARAQREIGTRSAAIIRQRWRLWRNRRMRGEITAIMAVVDPEWKPGRER